MSGEEGRRHLQYIADAFKEYLVVYVSVKSNEPTNEELPAIVVFTVSNTASKNLFPNIVFEEVIIRVGNPPDWHKEKYKNLEAGQSFEYQYRCPYSEILNLQYEVEGNISPIEFFKVNKGIGNLSGKSHVLSPIAYLKFLNSMKIHTWLSDKLMKIPIPEPNTTLAEIEKHKNIIRTGMNEIKNYQNRLKQFVTWIDFADKAEEEEFMQFHNQVSNYLVWTSSACEQLSETLGNASADKSGDLTNIKNNLAGEALKINMATEKSMHHYGISDKDSDYAYRNWRG